MSVLANASWLHFMNLGVTKWWLFSSFSGTKVAFSFNISVPIHTLFRSCNVIASVLLGCADPYCETTSAHWHRVAGRHLWQWGTSCLVSAILWSSWYVSYSSQLEPENDYATVLLCWSCWDMLRYVDIETVSKHLWTVKVGIFLGSVPWKQSDGQRSP